MINAETGLLSHPSTLECVSPNSGILFPNLFGASSERITLYISDKDLSCEWQPVCYMFHCDIFKTGCTNFKKKINYYFVYIFRHPLTLEHFHF